MAHIGSKLCEPQQPPEKSSSVFYAISRLQNASDCLVECSEGVHNQFATVMRPCPPDKDTGTIATDGDICEIGKRLHQIADSLESTVRSLNCAVESADI